MITIFISHSSADNAAAAEMKAWLEAQGYTSLFLDFDPEAGIKGGSGWEQTLYRQLRQSQAVIALLTPSWLASKWCFAELVQARERGKAIFLVKVQPCEAGEVFGNIQQIDLTAEPEEGYRRLRIGLLGLDPSAIHAAVPSPDLDPEAFFRRLTPSSRRALNHAAGISQYFTSFVPEKTELSKTKSSEPLPNWQAMRLDYVIAGLFENDSGPTRRLFLSKNIDAARFAMLVEQAAGLALPSRADYSPIILDKLPPPDPHTEQALQAARDIADILGAPQIQSQHLLYGALSIKHDPLITLLAEAGVRQEDVPLSEPNPTTVPTSIAFVSADTSDGEDLLGFDADVNALSAIIAAKDVAPPLSIGLFGDWGSGKSFFMGRMDERIRKLTDIARASNGKSAYHSNIVQIWFNAWSYVEADLWASLVTDIFEALARAIEDDEELAPGTNPATAKARLLAAMACARDVVAEEERRRDAAKAELEAVEQYMANLKVTDRELQEKLGSRALLKDAYRAIAKQPEIKARLDEAAERLNIPKAERAVGELGASLLEIKGIWSALGFALKGWKSLRAGLLAAGVLLAVLISIWVLLPWALKIHLDSTIAKVSAVLLSAAAWLAPFLKKAAAGVAIIKSVKDKQQQRIQEERDRIASESREQRQGISKKLSEAEQQVDKAKDELKRTEQTLKEMRADRQLLAFIRERSLSTDYTSRLGTVARARRDFKQLSDLMDRVRNEKQDGSASEPDEQVAELLLPRIDRIVLYIDDLDRCSEDKVVKVLEAVHLLLAFRLFVVIVAVDSRWLLHSLRRHSAAFQTSNGGAAGISDEELAHWESTPLNYLEKIFQIPFYLRPMRKGGFGRMVDAVVGKVHIADPGGRETAEVSVPGTPGVGSARAEQAQHAAERSHKLQTPQPTSEEANPAALQLREWERDVMKKLHPLIVSPRSAKRFVNIYRLMRVSITDQAALTAFVGDKNEGHHRAALLLLAILAGYPAEATDILRDLLQEERPETWWQYIDNLEAHWNKPAQPSTGAGSLSTQRRRDLMDKLRLLRGEIPLTQSCDQFVKCASKVARYSFESGRVLTLMNEETVTD